MAGTALLSDAQWAAFRQAINDASATFFNANVIWKHQIKKLAYDGDDAAGTTEVVDISLLGYIQYNVFRVWPADKLTPEGKVQKDSIVLILNKDYINDLGYLNANGNFDYLPDYDRFVVDGKIYKEMGGSQAAQANNNPMLFYIILAPDELGTGEEAL